MIRVFDLITEVEEELGIELNIAHVMCDFTIDETMGSFYIKRIYHIAEERIYINVYMGNRALEFYAAHVRLGKCTLSELCEAMNNRLHVYRTVLI